MRWALVVLLGACSYGILSTFAKLAYAEGFTPAEVIGSEMLFGAAMAWLLVGLTGKLHRPTGPGEGNGTPGTPAKPGVELDQTGRKIGVRTWAALLGVGGFIGLTTTLYFSSVHYVPASIAIVLLFQFTWIGVMFEAVWQRRWPSRGKVIALMLLFVGTLMTGGVLQGEWRALPLPGLILGLLSAVSFATYINLSSIVATDVKPVLRSAIMLSGALLFVITVFPPAFLWQGALAAGLWRWGLLLGFFGCIAPTVCFAIGVPRVGGGLATILGSAELPTAILTSALVLGEHVQPIKWIGVAVILVGIVLAEAGRGEKTGARATHKTV